VRWADRQFDTSHIRAIAQKGFFNARIDSPNRRFAAKAGNSSALVAAIDMVESKATHKSRRILDNQVQRHIRRNGASNAVADVIPILFG